MNEKTKAYLALWLEPCCARVAALEASIVRIARLSGYSVAEVVSALRPHYRQVSTIDQVAFRCGYPAIDISIDDIISICLD